MKLTVTKFNDGASKALAQMVQRASALRTFIQKNIYPYYQDLQRKRWMTEGASEGNPWPALSPQYAAYKKRRYGGGPKYKWVGGFGPNRPWQRDGNWPSFPGKGQRMMVATGRLMGSVIGPGPDTTRSEDHFVQITDQSLIIGTRVPYAKEAGERRPFFKFRREVVRNISQSCAYFIKTGQFMPLKGG